MITQIDRADLVVAYQAGRDEAERREIPGGWIAIADGFVRAVGGP
jgi:hypothetical protein